MVLLIINSIEGFIIQSYCNRYCYKQKKLSSGFSVSKYYKAVKEEAFQELTENAKNLDANAVVGIKVEIELTAHN